MNFPFSRSKVWINYIFSKEIKTDGTKKKKKICGWACFGKFSSIICILKAYVKLIFFMSNNEDGKVLLNRDEIVFFFQQAQIVLSPVNVLLTEH